MLPQQITAQSPPNLDVATLRATIPHLLQFEKWLAKASLGKWTSGGNSSFSNKREDHWG